MIMKSIPKRAGMSEEKRADKGLGDATKRVERRKRTDRRKK